MSGLLAIGVLPLAWVAGLVATRLSPIPHAPDRCVERVAVRLVVGLALVTPGLVLAATLGVYDAAALGTLGWVAAVLALLARSRWTPLRCRLDASDACALFVVVAFAAVTATGRDESLGAGRDQQVYAEFAIALAERGRMEVAYAPLDEADRELLAQRQLFHVPGTGFDGNGVDRPLLPQFPAGWIVWLAVAYASFGLDGLNAANVLVFAIGATVFYALARRLAGGPLAATATAALCALPSSIWIAGTQLSEPLAMTLLLALPLLVHARARQTAWIFAAVVFTATLVRVDALLVIPALLAAAVTLHCGDAPERSRRYVRRYAVLQLLAGLAATALILATRSQYLLDNRAYLITIGAVSAVLVVLLFSGLAAPTTAFGRLVADRRSAWLAAAVLAILFAYAALARPQLQPYSLIPAGAGGLSGTRDFREESVVGLASYLSWPLLVAGVGGACLALVSGWATRGRYARATIVAMGLLPALLYLWFPHVSPDHPWAIRRFVPQVIPFLLLFATLLARELPRRFGRWGLAAALALLVVPPGLLLARAPEPVRLKAENEGLADQIAAIAQSLPDGLVVSIGPHENIAAALLVAHGKPVAITDGFFRTSPKGEAIARWVASKRGIGRPAWLLHGPDMPRNGLRLEPVKDWRVAREFVAPVTKAPATSVGRQEQRIFLSRATGLDPSFADRMFGGEWSWGSSDRGFYESEVAPFGMFRYTRDSARVCVPATGSNDPAAVKVDLFVFAEPGTSRLVRFGAYGTELWQGSLPGGLTTLLLPLSGISVADEDRCFHFVSETVDPAVMGVVDGRKAIGVGVVGIRPMQTPRLDPPPPGIDGFRARLASYDPPDALQRVRSGQEGALVLDVRNAGSHWWPTVRDLDGPIGAVRIALRWYPRGELDRYVADNRWSLAIALLPGDRTRIRVPLAATGLDGSPLPPGNYEVRLFMVREGHANFPEGDQSVVRTLVTVEP